MLQLEAVVTNQVVVDEAIIHRFAHQVNRTEWARVVACTVGAYSVQNWRHDVACGSISR